MLKEPERLSKSQSLSAFHIDLILHNLHFHVTLYIFQQLHRHFFLFIFLRALLGSILAFFRDDHWGSERGRHYPKAIQLQGCRGSCVIWKLMP